MKIKKILEQVLTEEDNYDKLVKAFPELLEEDVVTDDPKVDEKVLTEDTNTFNSMKTALTAGKIDDLVYDSAYTEYIDEIYMDIVEELCEKYKDLYIEPSIQAGSGGVFATFVSDGETYKNNWDYRTECERIEEFAVDAETEEEFKSLIKEYIVSKLNDARPDRGDDEDSDDIEEKLTEDLSDAEEDKLREQIRAYFNGHPYPSDMDPENIAEEVCENLFDIDYNNSDNHDLTYIVFSEVNHYLDNKESIDEWPEYDDDYDFEDDVVEQDRMHAALYGGDREYCDKCGSKLVMDEWGGSCPKCDAEELFINKTYHDASEDELRKMGAFDNLDDINLDESFDKDGNREYCDRCNTPLNDQGTCPKCDDGEEDYDDKM